MSATYLSRRSGGKLYHLFMADKPKAKTSALKKKVVDDAPITIAVGKRGAKKWRRGNGPWRYDEPPQHKPKQAPTPSTNVGHAKVVGVPAGTDIRTHLKDVTGHATVQETLNAISAVHGNGGISKEIAIDRVSHLPDKVWGRYLAAARRVEVAENASDPVLTLVHELGHAIDDQGPWGKSRLTGGSPRRLWSWNRVHEDPWHTDHGAAAVRETIVASKAVAMLKTTLARARGSERKYLSYLLQPNELWARAYTQYIASKQADNKLLGALTARDEKNKFKKQWNEDDFKPIEAAIDQVIRGAGWRK